MNWSRDEVRRILSTKITDQPLADGGHVTIVHFEDRRMRYELWVHETGVFLAADSERPVQGLPFFEISLACTTLAPVPRESVCILSLLALPHFVFPLLVVRTETFPCLGRGGLNDPHNTNEAVA